MILFVCASAKFDLPLVGMLPQSGNKTGMLCHRCNEPGHKALACPRTLTVDGTPSSVGQSLRPYGFKHDLRPLDQVTCFKVGICSLLLVFFSVNVFLLHCIIVPVLAELNLLH